LWFLCYFDVYILELCLVCATTPYPFIFVKISENKEQWQFPSRWSSLYTWLTYDKDKNKMYCSKLLKIVFGPGGSHTPVPLLFWCVNIRIMSCVCIYSISFYFCQNKLTQQILSYRDICSVMQ
jgi:hypothetical protein